ncbi:MAG TPA: acyl carrier protein [Puia sp.]|jgi:acyl carrier protein|nr:acyl carrier protein [Puia sp.]
MEKKEKILQEIAGIFRKELEDQDLDINYGSSANSVEKWDSINNLVLLTAIEEKFNIVFPIEFIFRAEKVGDLCDYILENATIVD